MVTDVLLDLDCNDIETVALIREAGTAWIVMADPEGNELCLCVT